MTEEKDLITYVLKSDGTLGLSRHPAVFRLLEYQYDDLARLLEVEAANARKQWRSKHKTIDDAIERIRGD